MAFSRQLERELEEMNAKQEMDEKRPEQLKKRLETVGSSIEIYEANLSINSEAIFEDYDKKSSAIIVIQRHIRGFLIRRRLLVIKRVLAHIDDVLKIFVHSTSKSSTGITPSKWQTEAKLYLRIMERLAIQQLEKKEEGEKYPRRVNRPSITFTFENFRKYLDLKLAVATEFRRRAISSSLSQSELPNAFKALSVVTSQHDISQALQTRFGMRYRYKTKPLPAFDFIDLFWILHYPPGTPIFHSQQSEVPRLFDEQSLLDDDQESNSQVFFVTEGNVGSNKSNPPPLPPAYSPTGFNFPFSFDMNCYFVFFSSFCFKRCIVFKSNIHDNRSSEKAFSTNFGNSKKEPSINISQQIGCSTKKQ